MVDRKIQLDPKSWVNKCEEQLVYDSVKGANIRFFDMFKPVVFENFDQEFEHVVEGKTRLDQLAKRYYDNELLWWVIAQRNDMDLPDADLYDGMRLKIPAKEYVESELLRRR